MGKGKTTRIISGGGAYIGKDGKRYKWSEVYGYKPTKITDDNWMEYGMPADDETNESKNMNKKLIRLTESDLHRIVKESVNRILKEEVNPIPTYYDGRPMSFADITAVASISAMSPQHYDSLSQELKDMINSCKAYLKYMKDPQTIDYNLSL